jgi:hypothetical protein
MRLQPNQAKENQYKRKRRRGFCPDADASLLISTVDTEGVGEISEI